jgi:hypothetical protein
MNALPLDDFCPPGSDSFVAHSNNGSTNAPDAAQALVANFPLIIGTLGHATVLTALEYSSFYQMAPFGPVLGPATVTAATVRDPWPERGRRTLSAKEWFSISFAAQVWLSDVEDEDTSHGSDDDDP